MGLLRLLPNLCDNLLLPAQQPSVLKLFGLQPRLDLFVFFINFLLYVAEDFLPFDIALQLAKDFFIFQSQVQEIGVLAIVANVHRHSLSLGLLLGLLPLVRVLSLFTQMVGTGSPLTECTKLSVTALPSGPRLE